MLYDDHDCDIDLKTQRVFFLPNQPRLKRLCQSLRSIFLASVRNPRAHRYLRNQSAIIYERRRHLRNNTCIIHPFSMFSHWWDFVMVLNLVTSMLFVPHQAAFDMKRTSMQSWTLLKNTLLLIDCIDVLLNLATGYFDKAQRVVIMKWEKITKRYMFRGTFFPDVLGSLPTDLIFLPFWSDAIIARELSSLIHIFRIFSMYSFIAKIAEIYDVPRRSFGIFTLLPLFLFCLHWLTCITWIIPVSIYHKEIDSNFYHNPSNSWILNDKDLLNSDSQKKYWTSLMRSIAILTRSGFLSKEPTAAEDQYLAVVIQISSCILVCYVLAHAMQMFKTGNSSKLKYQTTVAQLKQYMSHKQLPAAVQHKFLTYYEFRYQERYFRESEILNTVSSQMRMEIGMHSCRKLVENVNFFSTLPVSLLTRIVALLKSEIFLTNDIIVRCNQPGDCMYFIATGTVAVYSDSRKEICHLEDGAYFGEIALVMHNERRVATVVAVETCELYRLERNDFIRTIHPYPMFWERIKKLALKRHEKTMTIDAD